MTIEANSPRDFSIAAPLLLWARLRRVAFSNPALAFADQCSVSGQAFVVLLMMGAFSDLAQVGKFAIALSVIATALAIQDAAITRPYTVQLHTPISSARRHLRASLQLSLALTLLVFFLVLAVGLALLLADRVPEAQVAFALALALPGALLREFGRRVSFAHERSSEAVLIDAPAVCVGLAGILTLGWFGHLSAATGLLVLAATNLVAALCWVLAKRLNAFDANAPTKRVAVASWDMGRWLIVYQLGMQAQGYTTHWLALVFLSAQATGTYAASLSIIAFSNPLLYGLFNIMVPNSAKIFRHSGHDGIIRRALRDSIVLGGLMTIFCIVIALFGPQIMAALYPKIGDARHLLIVLAVSAMVAAIGAPAAIALTSANKARYLASITAFGASVNLAAILVLLPTGGLLGAAYGSLIAELVGAAARWAALHRVVGSRAAFHSNAFSEVTRHAG